MRSRRGFGGVTGAALALFASGACSEPSGSSAPPRAETSARIERVAAAPKAMVASTNPSGFCEKSYPGVGPEARAYTPPTERPIPAHSANSDHPRALPRPGAWIWVNLWATWCKPCIEEMDLIGRWRDTLARDGSPVQIEMWSIDAEADGAKLGERASGGTLPGPARWVSDNEAFLAFLARIGVDAAAPIPIHVLVDPGQKVRCVRVGVIREEDYGAVKSIIAGG